MKERLKSLDGLRGLAALGVFLSHTGFEVSLLTHSAALIAAYHTLAVGPNSVQILFVLSGFLMAYLYPIIPFPWQFIQKRYARVIPVYSVVVIYLWLTVLEKFVRVWYLQVVLLFVLALGFRLIWLLLQRVSPKSGKFLFSCFLFLQIIMFLINFFFVPHVVQNDQIILPLHIKNVIIGLSNLTLTTPFAKDIIRMGGVFWSLAPEVLFYLLYPFLVIPLVRLGKKWGVLATILIAIGVIKMLFDLDHVFMSLAGFQSMNVARASGFVVGVIIGSLYQERGQIWQKVERLFQLPLMNILLITAFLFVQWADWGIKNGQSVIFQNYYYLTSSVIIGLVVVAAIIPVSLLSRLLSHKWLTFLGLISYSLYLIHAEVMDWIPGVLSPVMPFLPTPQLAAVVVLIVTIVAVIATSYMLYQLVESLYFAHKHLAKKKKKVLPLRFPPKNSLIGVGVVIVFLVMVYAGSYAPSLSVVRHPFEGINSFNSHEVSILQQPLQVPFQAKYDRLSIIAMNLRYAQDAQTTLQTKQHPAQLVFKLYDAQTKQKLFESSRNAYIVEGQTAFPFGFPTIADSSGKNYVAEVSLENGSENDQIFVDTSSTSLVSEYINPKSLSVSNIIRLLGNRLIFAFTNPSLWFALGFIGLLCGLMIKQPKHDRLTTL